MSARGYDQFLNNSAQGGTGYNNGQGKSGALFIYSRATASAANLTFTGSVAAQAGAGFSGSSPDGKGHYGAGSTCPGQDTVDICGALGLSVTVGTSQPGLSFTVDGTPYTSTQTFAWNAGDQHTLSTTVTQAGVGMQAVFTGWSDGTSNVSDAITVSSANTSYVANFKNPIPADYPGSRFRQRYCRQRWLF